MTETYQLEIENSDARKKALTTEQNDTPKFAESEEARQKAPVLQEDIEAAEKPASRSILESLPASVRDKSHVEVEGDQLRVFGDASKTRELFSATTDRLRSQTADERAISAMIAVAQHREWDRITVHGAAEFRREVWMEASMRGLEVAGYDPTERDLQERQERTDRYAYQEAKRAAREAKKAGKDAVREAVGRPAAGEKQAEDQVSFKDGVAGVLKEHGARPYQDNDKNEKSPYVVLDTPRGEKTLWGVGLPDALEREGVSIGDRIHLREAGKEKVAVDIKRKVDGKDVTAQTEVERRRWEVTLLKSREIENEQEDQRLMVEEEIEMTDDHPATNPDDVRNGGNGELENEVNRSGQREKDNGEELLKRQALEAQIERNLRIQHPENDTLVEKSMARARMAIDRAQANGKRLPDLGVTDKTIEKEAEASIDRSIDGPSAAEMAQNARQAEKDRDAGLAR